MDENIQRVIEHSLRVVAERKRVVESEDAERRERDIAQNTAEWDRLINRHIPQELRAYVTFDPEVNPIQGGWAPAKIGIIPEVPILFSANNHSFAAVKYKGLKFDNRAEKFEIEWDTEQWFDNAFYAVATATELVEHNASMLSELARCNADEGEINRARRALQPDPAKMTAVERVLTGVGFSPVDDDFRLAVIECLDRIAKALEIQ